MDLVNASSGGKRLVSEIYNLKTEDVEDISAIIIFDFAFGDARSCKNNISRVGEGMQQIYEKMLDTFQDKIGLKSCKCCDCIRRA